MSATPLLAANPFALMMDPEAVIRAVESSERLSGLRRQVFRPLDKGSTPAVGDAASVENDVEIEPDAAAE